ncbi:hypothetical protein MU582_17290 [Nocardioidaceae bacterium SCSIO 66511]|nr:hypothetical protein MU582_17290 [Nocardioidaceae bacterium SCSIO 66511]
MITAQVYLQLAADPPTADEVKPGWVALVIVLLMGIALAGLMWSMIRQFRKVDFEEEPDRPDDSAADDDAVEPTDQRETNGTSR